MKLRRPFRWTLDRTYSRFDQAARAGLAVAAISLGLAGCEKPAPKLPTLSHIPAGLPSRAYPPSGWTWSWLKIDEAPPFRYGVGVQPRAMRGAVLILPGFAEPAEAWFETAENLMQADYAVWILDLAGQGGSGRWTRPADKAHLPSMEVNLTGARAMLAQVMRPGPDMPVIVLGSGLGGQIALRAAALGLPEADGLILSSPSLGNSPLPVPGYMQAPAMAKAISLVGLDKTYAAGQGDWNSATSRTAPIRSRAASAQSWMRANADLRTGGVTWGWIRAYDDSAVAARRPSTLSAVRLPVLMLGNDDTARRTCAGMPSCTYRGIGASPHLNDGAGRQAWIEAVRRFADERSAGHIVAAAPVSP